MVDQPQAVRAELPWHRMKKTLEEARKRTVPAAPASLAETIANLELSCYPHTYQDMYLGSAQYTDRRKYSYTLQ